MLSPTERATMQAARSPECPHRFIRRVAGLVGLGGIVLLAALGVWLRGALYNHLVRFPREAAAWQALRAERQPVSDDAGWREYRGILHSHSHLSHDCEVPFDEILQVLQRVGLDFICLSDHCIEGRADFSLQWRGLHEEKLFVPGFEMKEGFMPFGVKPSVVLSNQTDGPTLARQVAQHGGVLFYAHPEEPRAWEIPELTGMEIYNLHTDFKRLRGGLRALLPDLLVNLRRYPDQVYRSAFRRPTEFLQRWDELNRSRHITGIAANDCHQNVGLRAFYTAEGTIRLEDTSPRPLAEWRLNGLTRPVARLLLGPLVPGRKLFHVQLDPYERSARFVNTHVLARDLSESELLEALRAGRVYVGFDLLADSAGFRWFAADTDGTAVMGESRAWRAGTRLRALAPLPCRFTVLKDGLLVHQEEGRALDWPPPGPGKYRVEAELCVRGEWVPWIYANPVQLK